MKSPLQGRLLIASPQLQDPNFAQSVLLVVQHDINGAMGLILNRPLSMSVAEAWTQVSEIPYLNEDPLHQGGPCEGPLMVLHAQEDDAQLQIAEGIFLSSDAESVKRLVDNDERPLKFFVGYAGWSPGQLETEIGESAWHVAEAQAEQVFNTPSGLWVSLARAAARAAAMPKIDPKIIPPDPSMN